MDISEAWGLYFPDRSFLLTAVSTPGHEPSLILSFPTRGKIKIVKRSTRFKLVSTRFNKISIRSVHQTEILIISIAIA